LNVLSSNAVGFREGHGAFTDMLARTSMPCCAISQAPAPWRYWINWACGPGREILRSFKAMGHLPVGLDGLRKPLSKVARQDSGCEVLAAGFFSHWICPA